MTELLSLDGKVAIVTGAGRGIGRAIALAYGREGAKVVVASRTPSTVEAVAKEITDAGGEAIGVACDVSSKSDIEACVAKAVETFGGLHIVVNNAQGFGTADEPRASTVFMAAEDTDEAEWDYTLLTGPTATMRFMKAAFPHMKAAGYGRVINFASSSGQIGFEGNTCYNAAKEAIRAISRTAAREWGQHGITVNIINPALETRAFDAWKSARPDFVEGLKEKIPVRRLGDPEKDGAPIAVFLAGEGSGYMTGGTFMLEGGMHIAVMRAMSGARANAAVNRRWQVARPADAGAFSHDGGLALPLDMFETGAGEVPEPGPGELLVRAVWFSPDPMNHAWVRGLPGKFPPLSVGEAMKGGVAGRVVASNHPDWRVGEGVTGFLDWQDYTLSDGSDRLGVPLQRLPEGTRLASGLATLGMTGLCAWLGLSEIARPKPGDVVLVSGASGAIGSIAGQIAKLFGARTIGIARGPEKCGFVAGLGFDDVIDAAAGDLAAAIAAAAPGGIDVCFDNVGGAQLDAALPNLAHGARVVICGATAHYGGPVGITNHLMLAMRSATMAGFYYFDHQHRWAEGRVRLARWLADGAIREVLDIVEGFDRVAEVAVGQFDGGTMGRKLIRIADDPFA